MNEIRSFRAGVNVDAAPQEVQQGQVANMLNMRLTTDRGQGYVATTIAGNEQLFALTDGFLPLGHATYNGIAYIFSYNPLTGEGEVGTFPSPLYNGTQGFTQAYRPLQNWTDVNDPSQQPPPPAGDFKTTLFSFGCPNQLEVQARLSYDDSVDLFFTDFRNPFRKINSGFDHRTGSPNNRRYWTGSFPSQVDVMFESSKHPILDDVTLTSGGLLQAGNWFVYGRYVKQDLNPTSFLLEVGPIQVSDDDPASVGVRTDGQEGLANSGRIINLALSNIDPSFAYMQFAIVYYHDGTVETKLVTNLYNVPTGGGSMTVSIRGDETLADIAMGEIIVEKSTVDCVRTITQHERRMWGGSWKESYTDYEALQNAALNLKARPPLPSELLELDDQAFHKASAIGTPYQYKDYRNTLRNVGYFRGEPYAFAIQFVLKSGKLTIPYPVTGYDAWGDPGGLQPNTRGVLRFPAITQDGADYSLTSGDTEANTAKVRVMGLKLEPLVAWASLPQWIQDNVIGFYVVRAERKPQLMYQALVLNTYAAAQDTSAMENAALGLIGHSGDPTDDNAWSPYCIPNLSQDTANPETDSAFPSREDVNPSPGTNIDLCPVPRKPGKFGLFSTDHFFTKVFQDGQYFLQSVGRTRITRIAGDTTGERNPFDNYWERSFTRNSALLSATDFDQWDLRNIAAASNVPNNDFVSMFTEGNRGDFPSAPPAMFYFRVGNDEVGNRDMKQRNYIGATIDEGTAPGLAAANRIINSAANNADELATVNIYRTNPSVLQGNAVGGLYDPGLELYYRISDFVPIIDNTSGIPVNNWDALYSKTFYRGDCFVQRCYTKLLSDSGWHDITEPTDGSTFYNFGTVLGVVQECAVNSAMRYAEGTAAGDKQYTPGISWAQFALGLPATDNELQEMSDRNEGYDKTLGVRGRVGFDVNIPYRGQRYPVRLKYSEAYIPGASIDGYLQWDLAAERDYLHGLGEIMRVHSFGGLVVVQENAIIAPYTNEQAALQASDDSPRIVLGNGDVLSEQYRKLASVGTQHQWSCIATDAGIIGYDQQARAFWRFSGELERIDAARFYSRETTRISELKSPMSDVRYRYLDAPVCGEGVVAWWDKRNTEFGWSFGVITSDPGDVTAYSFETCAFNYKLNVWTGRRSHHSPYYITLNNDLYSFDKTTMPWGQTLPYVGRGYRHDALPEHSRFYGVDYQASISPIFNQAPNFPKLFDAATVSCADVPLDSVIFTTSFQSSVLPFNTTNPGLKPKYKETRWHFPVPKATAVTSGGVQEYKVKSPLRDRWMRMDLIWNTNQPVHVDLVSVEHRQSMQ